MDFKKELFCHVFSISICELKIILIIIYLINANAFSLLFYREIF